MIDPTPEISRLYRPLHTTRGVLVPPGVAYRYTADRSHEPVQFRTHLLIEKRTADGELVELVEAENNLLTTAGATELWTKLSAGTGTLWNTTNVQLVLGDSTVAAAASQPDMQAVAGTASNIASSTNATPIVVTLSTPLSPVPVAGQVVVVTGHTTNTNANGTWEIGTVTSSSIFQLLNSVGNGVGGAAGTVAAINKYRQQANATGSAVITGGQIVYVATIPLANGNFTMNEWGLCLGAAATNKQAAPPALLLNRSVTSLGNKPNTLTYTGTATLTVA